MRALSITYRENIKQHSRSFQIKIPHLNLVISVFLLVFLSNSFFNGKLNYHDLLLETTLPNKIFRNPLLVIIIKKGVNVVALVNRF